MEDFPFAHFSAGRSRHRSGANGPKALKLEGAVARQSRLSNYPVWEGHHHVARLSNCLPPGSSRTCWNILLDNRRYIRGFARRTFNYYPFSPLAESLLYNSPYQHFATLIFL